MIKCTKYVFLQTFCTIVIESQHQRVKSNVVPQQTFLYQYPSFEICLLVKLSLTEIVPLHQCVNNGSMMAYSTCVKLLSEFVVLVKLTSTCMCGAGNVEKLLITRGRVSAFTVLELKLYIGSAERGRSV